MIRNLSLILVISFGFMLAAGCGQGGKPEPVPPDYVGTTTIPDEIKYPGMEKLDDTAVIDFLTPDHHDVVAKWFEDTHEVVTSKRNLQSDYKYELTVSNWDIEIFPYPDGGSHLRYKRQIK